MLRTPKSIARRIADVMIDRATRGCTLADLLDEGFTEEEINTHSAEAEKLARKDFVRQAYSDATDQLAREDVEGGERNILVAIPVADLCHLWQGLRTDSSTVEATLRLKQAYREARV